MSDVTPESWRTFDATRKYLGSGSSTSSKIPSFEGCEPPLIAKGKGCRVWDVDGNQYIDFRNGLGPVTLGYSIDEINAAITSQIVDGIVFGHPHALEGDVAKLLVKYVPCAERVRFLKTGGEAVSACIKIARNATGRDKIIHCGYNGWLTSMSCGAGHLPDGIARSAPRKGVPAELCNLHKYLPWGETKVWEESFHNEGKDVAAVVIASSYPEMEKGKSFLPEIRNLTEKYGILMIMDEIVTGFRVAPGGIHEYYGFRPDMAVFAKGIANGMPLSAYLGKAELIDSSRAIGISSTFGGETLSLASAKATINFYFENMVIEHLWSAGRLLQQGINSLFKKHNIQAELKGFPVCPSFIFKDNNLRDAFFKGCYRSGLSFYTTVYVNFSHKERDIDETLGAIRIVLENLRK